MRRATPLLAVLLVTAALTAAAAAPAAAGPQDERVVVSLRRDARPAAAAALRAAGARLVDARLRLWELDLPTMGLALGALRARGELGIVQPVGTYDASALTVTAADPLEAQEWWRAAVGVDTLTPPGPGVPVTIVDSGVNLTHPEFAGRPDLLALNAQEPAPLGGEHGTAVSSIVGAPVNGVGVVGIYPQVALRSWDAAKGAGTQLETIEIINGITTAARSGPGVINLSLGGERDLAIELAVEEAVALGTLVIAASGNDGDRGSPLTYPASHPHVLTVGATDRSGNVASFSSRSSFVDVAAPGDEIPIASALGQNWQIGSGTSFAAPIVSGAAAWLWTVRPHLDASQVSEIIRRSARDIGPTGRDAESGFGLLDVRAALAAPAPVPDSAEPNDDVENVAPDGDRNFAHPKPLTSRTLKRSTVAARVDRWEDPRDVYRVWLPARRTLTATIVSSTDNDLGLFRAAATSVTGVSAADYRLARARSRGRTDRLTYTAARTGRWAYLSVTLPQGVTDATYRLAVTVR